MGDDGLWADGDLRWLAGISESGGITYVNKECFEELAWWLQLPLLIKAAGLEGKSQSDAIDEIEGFIAETKAVAAKAGYDLTKILQLLKAPGAHAAKNEAEQVQPTNDVYLAGDRGPIEGIPQGLKPRIFGA